ncbi:MAG: sensor histidine kinase [Butyricimonas faecihominis]
MREETFPPSVFFRQTIAAFLNNDPRTQYYQIETRIDPDIEKSTLHGDPGLLSRAINNLLYNSIQHTPAGTTLTLSLTYQSGFYRFSVFDNGKGFSCLPAKITNFGSRGNPGPPSRAGTRLGIKHCLPDRETT